MSKPEEGVFQIFSAVSWGVAAYTMRAQTGSSLITDLWDLREEGAAPLETDATFWQNKIITGADSAETINTSNIPLHGAEYAKQSTRGFGILAGPTNIGPLYDEATGNLIVPSGGARYGVQIFKNPTDGKTNVHEEEFPTFSDQRSFYEIDFNGAGTNPAKLRVGFLGTFSPRDYQESYEVSANVSSQADVDSLISDAMATAASGSTYATVTSGSHAGGYGVFCANATAGKPCYPFFDLNGSNRISFGGIFGGLGVAVGTATRPSPDPGWINGESVSVTAAP